jgi:sensor c-di-GMP phosphodiesterase-like protein
VDAALHRNGLPPHLLELEITEDIALSHGDGAKPLARLRKQGVKIAFDDFGTGFASLRYLTMFPVSRIKIDRTFVQDMANGAKSVAIVRSLIGMAKSLDLEVIAEGVETNAQATFLKNEHCEEAQGYLYGKPLSAVDFAVFMSLGSARTFASGYLRVASSLLHAGALPEAGSEGGQQFVLGGGQPPPNSNQRCRLARMAEPERRDQQRPHPFAR